MSEPQHNDTDYAFSAVPASERKGFWSMLLILLGFTFFSASMWTGAELAAGLNLNGFLLAVAIGGAILGAYTGALGYIGAKTGLNFDLLCHRAFGPKGSYLPSAMISLTQIGWTGVGFAMFAYPIQQKFLPGAGPAALWGMVIAIGVATTLSTYYGVKGLEIVSWISVPLITVLGCYAMGKSIIDGGGMQAIFSKSAGNLSLLAAVGMVIGSFVSGGTATPNFVRFARPNAAIWTTVIAFFLGNTLMFFFGGVAGAFTGEKDIFFVMAAMGLMIPAILVLGANIWTTNDVALYTGSLGLSNLTKAPKRPMVLVAGALATVFALWLYNHFCDWLTILNATLPPVGAILVLDYFRHKDRYAADGSAGRQVNWGSVVGVIGGATAGNLVHWGIPAITAMGIAAVCYLVTDILVPARTSCGSSGK
ncbi:MAG: cytosine permease [Kiritimatiellae bacterium]|nr:cytosine permease [Kiritimatiellia bacterium]MBR4251594.1 cytosine permease [Kiritimatiellia bacterium]